MTAPYRDATQHWPHEAPLLSSLFRDSFSTVSGQWGVPRPPVLRTAYSPGKSPASVFPPGHQLSNAPSGEYFAYPSNILIFLLVSFTICPQNIQISPLATKILRWRHGQLQNSTEFLYVTDFAFLLPVFHTWPSKSSVRVEPLRAVFDIFSKSSTSRFALPTGREGE